MNHPPLSVQLLLAALVIVAAVTDLRSRKVPNWLTISGLALGIALNLFLYASTGLWLSLKGAGLALLIYLPLYMLRGVGGGDVKMMAAIGAIAGPLSWMEILLLTALFGGLFALVILVIKHRLGQTIRNIGSILSSLLRGRAPFKEHPRLDVRNEQALRLPHAVVIACGAIAFLLAAR